MTASLSHFIGHLDYSAFFRDLFESAYVCIGTCGQKYLGHMKRIALRLCVLVQKSAITSALWGPDRAPHSFLTQESRGSSDLPNVDLLPSVS